MSKKNKPEKPVSSKKFWCTTKVLTSGRYRKCASDELYHVTRDQLYWPFHPENDEDFDPKVEYGAIFTSETTRTKRMIMHNIIFMSSNEEEVNEVMISGRLPSGSRLPNPKRRQTLTPVEFSLDALSFVKAVKSAKETKKTNIKAKAAGRQMQSNSILSDFVNQQRGSFKNSKGKNGDRCNKKIVKPISSQSSGSTSELRDCGGNTASKEESSLVTGKDEGSTHDRESPSHNRIALGIHSKVSTPESGMLQRELEKLREENEALKAKLIEEESTKSALLKLTQEVGQLKKSVESGPVSSHASKSDLANFVKEDSNPPEIEFLPYKSITLTQMQYIERNVFKFTAKVNKICDHLFGDKVHLYFVRGPKSTSDNDDDNIKIIEHIIFEKMSDVIRAMKKIKEEKDIDTSEAAVKRQVEKYTSYKRRQHATCSLPDDEKNKNKLEAKMKKESLEQRKGQKVFIISKRKRVYLKGAKKSSISDKTKKPKGAEESDSGSDSESGQSDDGRDGNGNKEGEDIDGSDRDNASHYGSDTGIVKGARDGTHGKSDEESSDDGGSRHDVTNGRKRDYSDSGSDYNVSRKRVRQIVSESEEESQSDDQSEQQAESPTRKFKFNPAHSEILFSELYTASEREVREYQKAVQLNPGTSTLVTYDDSSSDETVYNAPLSPLKPNDDNNRWDLS